MKTTGVAELKASLSDYLAAVKGGEEVIVTERGHAIARIVPIAAHTRDSRALENLVRAGLLRLPEKVLDKDFFRRSRAKDRRAAVRRALLKEREETR